MSQVCILYLCLSILISFKLVCAHERLLQRYHTDSGNMSYIANSSEGIPCSHYKELFPYKKRTNLDKQCKIMFTPSSKQYFTYKVLKFKYRFVNFHLRFLNLSSGSEIHYTRCVIQPMKWIWTFRGIEDNFGGRQYLDWPPEYDTMSMGMLATYTSPPLHMNLTVKGKCDIVIGAENTTMRLAMAFANFTRDLAATTDEYNYSYWCYKERIYVENYILYQICRHVICPIETIGYRCCKHTYDVNIHGFIVRCPGHFYVFGGVWWVCPFVIGSVLYLYFALILFSLLSVIYRHLPSVGEDGLYLPTLLTDKASTNNITHNSISNVNKNMIHHNVVTAFSIMVLPLKRLCVCHPIVTSRALRFLVVFSSISIIISEILVYSRNNSEYIIQSVQQGAPMNFLSMIAGYELSRENFLVFLGGPYFALSSYLICCIVFLCTPHSFSDFLEIGLPEKTNQPTFLFTIDLKVREYFGARRILMNGNDGYRKIQKTMLADIFCLLNPRFWKYAFCIQISRFKNATAKITGNRKLQNFVIILLLIIPYLTFCFVEILLTLFCYGFPTIFAIGLVYRAYTRNIYDLMNGKGKIGYLGMFILMPVCLILLTFTVYMFSIIFLDSFIFLSRVAIFTYTGLFANPGYTEGYLVFSITVTMYLYDSIHSINETYEQLFYQTKKVCKRVNKRLSENTMYRKDIEGGAIPLDVYLFVVDSHTPKRVEILKSVVKIATIFLFLYISVGILTQFDGFQQLTVVTQTATTTFVCLVPKIFTRMCTLNERRKILRIRTKVHDIVVNFLIFKGIEYEKGNYSLTNENSEVEQIPVGASLKLL